MRLFFDDAVLAHRPSQFMVAGRIVAPVEVPERALAMAEALGAAGLERRQPADAGLAPLAAVHTASYLAFLQEAYERFCELPGHGPEVWPNVHPYRGAGDDLAPRDVPPPMGIIGRAGWFVGDLACAIMGGTWKAAYASAQTAVAGADDLLAGARAAYALCRPPGHHAYADRASGFCFVNNAAIAAERLRTRFAKVAIVDFDTHHGDGTQAIFYRRADVLVASSHTDPSGYYPYFVGYAQERGAGAGTGFNLNMPLAQGSADDVILAANRTMADAVRAFRPEALVISAGWDAHKDDPLSRLAVTTAGFGRLGTLWGSLARDLGVPALVVQEGGYSLSAVKEAAPGFVAAYRAAAGV